MITKTEHLSFKLKSIIVMFSCVLCCFFTAKAQFVDIHSFSTDSLLRVQVKKNKVRSVTENRTKYNAVTRLNFDSEGRVIEYSSTGTKTQMTYDKKDRITKRTFYNQEDTSKVAYWDSFNFDEKGRLIGQENSYYANDTLIVTKIKDSKFILESKDKTVWEVYEYFGNTLSYTEYIRDSTVGIYSFSSIYKYREGDIDENGRKQGDKILYRTYTKNHCDYVDEVKYKVLGRLEFIEDIEKTRYSRYDERGRILEEGEINYRAGIMDFLQEHAEYFNGSLYCILSPQLIEAIFRDEVKGEKSVNEKYTFDEQGHLIEQITRGYLTYKFKYNKKWQVSEIVTFTTDYDGSSVINSTMKFWHNEKGLPIKSQNKYKNIAEESGSETVEELIYTYTYY